MGSAVRDYEALADAIRAADYRAAAGTFTALLREGQPIARLTAAAIEVTASYVQTPSHLMPLPDGRVRSVNYDHTILGWRASLRLAQRLGKRAGLLPITQAIWYVPQGLNVWDQVLCQFPGHYARDQEHCDDRAAGADAADAQPFDGPAWSGPQIYFPDQEPLAGSAAPQQIPDMLDAIRQGERAEAYRLFLAMAQEPSPPRSAGRRHPPRGHQRPAGHHHRPRQLPEHRPQGAPRAGHGGPGERDGLGERATASSTRSCLTSAPRRFCTRCGRR